MTPHKLNIASFALLILLLASFNLFSSNKPTTSEIEKRSLASLPNYSFDALKSGDFFKGFDQFFGDNFIYRESFVALGQTVHSLRGVQSEDSLQLVDTYGDNTFADTPFDEVNVELENEDPVTILFKENVALTLHKFYPQKAESYAKAVNSFATTLDPSVQVYSVLIPDRIEFETDPQLSSLSSSEKETINYVNTYLDKRIQPIDIYSKLSDNSRAYIYFKTDHHWTALGAYYGYSAFVAALGETPIPLTDYKVKRFENFLGSRFALNANLEKNPDYVDVYQYKNYDLLTFEIFSAGDYASAPLLDMTYTTQQNIYGVFMGGDHPLAKITSTNDNDKKILVIKDSYGNAFTPFLAPHYQETFIVDPRYIDDSFDIKSLIIENNITEVLFINTVSVTTKNSFPSIIEGLN